MDVNRRNILIGGGAGVGLLVAWSLWPRAYAPNLTVNPGEQAFGAWLKIGRDGIVTVAVPQAEHGQGITTTLAQIVADELGADWQTVAVKPAPINPLYANPVGVDSLFEGAFDRLSGAMRAEWLRRDMVMLTGGSSSIRMFEAPARAAAATARALMAQAAARRWGLDWTACEAKDGFIIHDGKRLRFAELAEAAAGETVPAPLPLGSGGAGRLAGGDLPRLDSPAKIDGSANFTADIRLSDMVHVAIRHAPLGRTRAIRLNRDAAMKVTGVVDVIEGGDWVAVAAASWWVAQRGLDAAAPRAVTDGPVPSSAGIAQALDKALGADGRTVMTRGDVADALDGEGLVEARYRIGVGVHAAIEPRAAVAAWRDDALELWVPTQVPAQVRALAADAVGLDPDRVIVHPMPIGGSFGVALESDAAIQAATIAAKLKRPVNLQWSRADDLRRDAFRAPALARLTARVAKGGIVGWRSRIATPSTGPELAHRVMPGGPARWGMRGQGRGDAYAMGGAVPPYAIPALAVHHHDADLPIPTGHVRGGAHVANVFASESFIDELAGHAGADPLAWRIAMLGDEPRLARCLSTAASLGGWEGGGAGSGQGVAVHAFRGSYIAVLAEAHRGEDGRPVVDRLVAALDCGRVVNPDIVRQQVEGGLIFGLAHLFGTDIGFSKGLAEPARLGALRLPLLADTPDITVELIASDDASGGVGELAVPPVAPAIANALATLPGSPRIRSLPMELSA
ncbi:molybdopterin-dependent oxidoreductase [Sphingomonas sanguinis]|uniref:xanthine dehydrogenase family protein molybdopterin-binding subunit n=1 Tax=Sphingomonas sp. LC-1 TaxID=3110957 RepID=UPI0021BB015C|nr:molybdopterin cofactor-binding domain-containing protein [Sphingomonas sp. LC-1]MCT8001167.1 molybdopterin-dependent oxidoreductase [Sphingomonas sp. LC-1]